MKLDEIKQIEVTRIGDTEEGIKAGIDNSSLPFVFEILTKGFYSNSIGSVVREITSNCFDSHIEAGVTEPVVITKTHSLEEGYSIEFKDVGIGLSKERIVFVYMNYFSSTKRKTNDQIGGFGLGSKTPLAYADMFYITTNFEGIKYELIMHRGESSPQLESIHGWVKLEPDEPLTEAEEAIIDEGYTIDPTRRRYPTGIPTTDRNGTVIKINVATEDIETFKEELKGQLAYFDDVYFTGWGISNDYDIYEGKYFKFRSDIKLSRYDHVDTHIVLGKVRYPIDFNRVKVPSNLRKIPIAVKFNIGELRVTPNRENLRYKDEDIKLITKRLMLAVEELKFMYANQNPVINDLGEYSALKDSTPRITFSEEKDHLLDLWVESGLDKSYRYRPLVDIGLKKTPKNLFFMYQVIGTIDSKGKKTLSNHYFRTVDNDDVLTKRFVYIDKDDKHQSIYTDHRIAEEVGQGNTVLILKRVTKIDYNAISLELKLKDDKGLGKAKLIQQYIKVIEKELKSRGRSYLFLKADDLWIRDYKRKQKEASAAYQRKIANKIFIRSAREDFGGVDIPVAELKERKGILVYGFRDDKQILQKIWKTVITKHRGFKTKLEKGKELRDTGPRSEREARYEAAMEDFDKGFMLIIVAKSNVEAISGSRKTIYWENFLKTIFFRKIETAYRIRTGMQQMGLNGMTLRSQLIKDFAEDRAKVINMIDKHSTSDASFDIPIDYQTHNYIESMMKEYNNFRLKHGRFIPLLDAVDSHMILTDSIRLESMVAYLKSLKIRLNNKYYNKPSAYLNNFS